jgi:hypothetical protein
MSHLHSTTSLSANIHGTNGFIPNKVTLPHQMRPTTYLLPHELECEYLCAGPPCDRVTLGKDGVFFVGVWESNGRHWYGPTWFCSLECGIEAACQIDVQH